MSAVTVNKGRDPYQNWPPQKCQAMQTTKSKNTIQPCVHKLTACSHPAM